MELEKNRALFTALAQLHADKPFSDITISELTSKAGVSRMYYYRNFTTFQDIIDQHIAELVSLFIRKVSHIDKRTLKTNATAFFQCLSPDAAAFNIFLTRDGATHIQAQFEQSFARLVKLGFIDSSDDPYWRAYTIGGLSRLITVWLVKKQPESARLMADKVERILSSELK